MKNLIAFSLGLVLFSSLSFAEDQIPDCPGAVNVNNEQVIQWKKTTPNQYLARGHIDGTVQRIFKNKTGHRHWEILIGSGADAVVEVIYNEDFGKVPNPYIGMKVEACGDYITSNKKVGSLQPSPDGAIVHWVHKSTSPKHPSGFLVIDGSLYGQDLSHAKN